MQAEWPITCAQLKLLLLAVAGCTLDNQLQDRQRDWLSGCTHVHPYLLLLSAGEEAGEGLYKAVSAWPRPEVCHTWAGKCLLSLPVKLLHDRGHSAIQWHWLAEAARLSAQGVIAETRLVDCMSGSRWQMYNPSHTSLWQQQQVWAGGAK